MIIQVSSLAKQTRRRSRSARGRKNEQADCVLALGGSIKRQETLPLPSLPEPRFITSFIRHDDDGGGGPEPLRIEHLHRHEVLREDLQPLDGVPLRGLVLDADLP